MIEHGEAFIELPKADKFLASELRASGLDASRIKPLPQVDVKALRSRLGLTALAFAKRYSLNPRTVEGWESGKPIEATANTYLHAIAFNPSETGKAFEEKIG